MGGSIWVVVEYGVTCKNKSGKHGFSQVMLFNNKMMNVHKKKIGSLGEHFF